MKRQIITANAAQGDGPYSQCMISRGIVYVSGQGPLHPANDEIIGSTIEEQADRTLQNLRSIVLAAGCTMEDVVKVNVFLADMNDFARFNTVYKQYFSAPFPARTCVEAGLDGILVEIDAIAHVPEEKEVT
ncbi:Rid family detoxifying hydrolase [Paenibacillus mendelii]|uniref:Rid family detoxifying hydrolase n=1 Tax=Paenibacillus mendelii TaxID=206163 RepID=A0ABV6J5J9_9BACL|nr:Rid family detoxifying hydrolase [Paenibacillus mendelii]MCQ6560463.1 Rid family detoxifying hydrolase [Paenibacillus mendelii]